MQEQIRMAEERDLTNDPNSEAEEDTNEKEEEAEKTILVPKVIDMDTYFREHYSNRITEELNTLLVEGDIASKIGCEVVSERILPEECRIKDMYYWRESRDTVLIDVTIRVELRVRRNGETDTDFFWFYLGFWFCFGEDEEECTLDDFGLFEDRPVREDCWRLDNYLVPVLRRDGIEKYAPEIWEKYLPEAASDPLKRNPKVLAKKMGLTVLELNLHKRPHVKGIIFFEQSKILVQPKEVDGICELPGPVEMVVRSNTIVLNRHEGSIYDHDFDLYHECIHYEWHYMFYRLQAMHSTDIDRVKKVRVTVKKNDRIPGPTGFMEMQANIASYCVMMPQDFIRDQVRTLYEESKAAIRKNGYYPHDGFAFDYIGRKIAEKYFLSKARVKSRLIQLGYSAAEGALNYVDGRYIEPFGLSDPGNAHGQYCYTIDRKNVMRLYKKDKKFRELMQSGFFVYVDGHVVYNKTDEVRQTPYGSRLSAWVNAHADERCLRFRKTYTGMHQYSYSFGQMNSEEALRDSLKFLDANSNLSIKDAQQMKDQLMEDMPMSFHGALSFIMKGRVTVDELVERIPISRSTLLRLRTEERDSYELDQIIAICIGLHLPPWLSEILLDRAGLKVKRYGPKGYYGTILDCFYMDSFSDVQKFLNDNGYPAFKLVIDPDVVYEDSSEKKVKKYA